MTPESTRELRRLPRRIYPFRVLGMALSGVAMAAVLIELQAPWPLWVLLVFTSLIWPHFAYRLALRSRDHYRAETLNLLVDSVITGA
jgi:diguanylate cyclase